MLERPAVILQNKPSQDVDEEFVIMFLVSDENQSNYLQKNIDTYGGMEENEVRPRGT